MRDASDFIKFIDEECKKDTSNMLLIAGFPRSGTTYTSLILKELGLKIGHEVLDRDGAVSWIHASILTKGIKFKKILHQVRNPLYVISSSQALPIEFMEFMEYYIEKLDFDTQNILPLAWAYAWVYWNKMIDNYTTERHRIEDIEKYIQCLCYHVGVDAPNEIPLVPKDTNTWGPIPKIDWEKVHSQDKSGILKKVTELALSYGYTQEELGNLC